MLTVEAVFPAGVVKLTWPELRNMANDNGLVSRLRELRSGKYLVVYLGEGQQTFACATTSGHAHGQEWDSTYKGQTIPVVNSSGMPVIVEQDIPPTAKTHRRSWQYSVPPSTTSIFEERVDGMAGSKGFMHLTGGSYKCRDSAVEGSSIKFAIVDRDDLLGLFATYGFDRCRLTGLTSKVGTFTAGNTVVGDTSGASAVVLEDAGGTVYVRADYVGTFQDGEGLTEKDAAGNTTGTTATLGSYSEGDVLSPYGYFVEDEWLEGFESDEIEPKGAERVPKGLYLRTVVYNANPSASLRVKVTFKSGKE